MLGHTLAGLGVGLIFGSMVLRLTPPDDRAAGLSVAWAVNELLFPVGCSVIVFLSRLWSSERGSR